MVLTNYWWLLIWLAVAGGICVLCFPQRKVAVLGETEFHWDWLPALIVAVPYVIWAMNRVDFIDTETYRAMFDAAPSSITQIASYLEENEKDRGYSIFTILLKSLIGDNDKAFFLIIAAVQIFCVVYFFRKYSPDFLLSLFLFVASTDYLSWVFNTMRQFLVVCILLFTYDLVLKKKYLPAVLLILFMATIHASALIMLPIIFVVQGKAWNKRTILMLFAVATVILFIDEFTTILDTLLSDTQYSDIITNEIWTNDDGTNILRALFYSIPAVLSIVGKAYINETDRPEINMFVNCTIVTSAFYFLSVITSGIYVGRLPIYTTLPGYVAFPWMINYMFDEKSARMVKGVVVVVYVIFFYYQTHMVWGIT